MADNAYKLDPALEPDISHLVIEDDEPVPSIFHERQQRLLVDCLYTSWAPEGGRPFLAFADVGLFFALHEPPMIPDAMLALDVRLRPEHLAKENANSYLVWEIGKPPDVVVEVVSNRKGGEQEKIRRYADIGVKYYAIYDPSGHLAQRPLRVFQLHGTEYVELLDPALLPGIGLGLVLWEGEYQGFQATYLRWCDAEKQVLPTGKERAERLAQKLRELGVEPD